MRLRLFLIIAISMVAMSLQATTCTIILDGDWTNSTLRIKEPNGGLDTTINTTTNVEFEGTGNATFFYNGIDGVNTFTYNSCAGYSYSSPFLTNLSLYLSPSALPVELSYFGFVVDKNNVYLKFQTDSEVNNSHFEIEKSTNGTDFYKIGRVTGHGTTIEQQYYSFVDNTNHKGLNYYRLKQVDYDGSFEYSNTLVATVDFETTPLLLSSNVVYNSIELKGEGGIFIINSMGQVLKTLTINGQHTIDISEFHKGIYYIKSSTDTIKFVKI